jgi:putative heme iron utilization protein
MMGFGVMNYFLIKPDGEVNGFYVLECAKVYQNIHGGTIHNWANMIREGLDMNSEIAYDLCVGNDDTLVNKELDMIADEFHESVVTVMHESMEDEIINSVSKLISEYAFSDYYVTEYEMETRNLGGKEMS